ncbi:metallophosphoesterase family protein, partial [Thermodesulfobacteriota bacterium]
AFRGVELILHAGDIYLTSVLDELSTIAPILASKGDDDYGEALEDERVKESHVLTIEGVTIWLFHEYKKSEWCRYEKSGKDSWDRPEDPPDVLVYGHTHQAAMGRRGPVLRITPGSATFPCYKHKFGTVGLLRVESGKSTADIIQL